MEVLIDHGSLSQVLGVPMIRALSRIVEIRKNSVTLAKFESIIVNRWDLAIGIYRKELLPAVLKLVDLN
jgi:hypothetical protein